MHMLITITLVLPVMRKSLKQLSIKAIILISVLLHKNVNSTYRGDVFGMCEFRHDRNNVFCHQVKFYTIKELLEMGCVVSRLDKTSYAVSGFVDLDDSLIKEYQITRL